MEANSRDQLVERSSVVVGGVVCHPQPLTRGEVTVHTTNNLQIVEDKLRENEKHLFKTSPLKNYFFVELYRKPNTTERVDRGTAFLTNIEVERADDGGGKRYTYATFLTAAHVLYSFDRIVLKHSSDLLKDGEALEKVEAFVDLSKPTKYKKGWFEVCPNFTNPVQHTAGPYDYGAIFVEKKYLKRLMEQSDMSLGGRFIVPQSHLTNTQDVFVAGYPEKLHHTNSCTYLASCEGKYLPRASKSWPEGDFIEKRGSGQPVQLPLVDVHTADTMPGMSGSPVVVGTFSSSGVLSQAEWTAVAIHVGGEEVNGAVEGKNTWSHNAPEYLSDHGKARGLNFAVPVTQQMIREILSASGKPAYDEPDYGHALAGGEDIAESGQPMVASSVKESPGNLKVSREERLDIANMVKNNFECVQLVERLDIDEYFVTRTRDEGKTDPREIALLILKEWERLKGETATREALIKALSTSQLQHLKRPLNAITNEKATDTKQRGALTAGQPKGAGDLLSSHSSAVADITSPGKPLRCGMKILLHISRKISFEEDMFAIATELLDGITPNGGRAWVESKRSNGATLNPSLTTHEVLEHWCKMSRSQPRGGKLYAVLEAYVPDVARQFYSELF